jgi:hypothetical protein
MAKPTPADVKLLTDAELEAFQLAVNAEVAIRIQNERLKDRMVTILVEAQGVGFTDAEIQKAFEDSRTEAHKGKRDPDLPKDPPLGPGGRVEPKKLARGLSERSRAVIQPRTTKK